MPIPAPKPVHVVYRTRRPAAMLKWYQTVFGAKIVYRNEALAFATFDEEHHRFAFADLNVIAPDGGNTDDIGTVGVDHVAYDLPSLRGLLEAYAELKQAGIEPYWCVNHGMSASLYYADPDGNQMEFAVDCFASKAECSAYWSGPEIGQNPVGVEFDPDDWLERLRVGEAEADLLKIDVNEDASPIRGALERIVG
ncbi:MAG: VOC family protein [Pacificimonas sp.]|jgi:catechol-2,3-dioxygenase|nr:VOC family protein [Pacificimonas sp.]